MVTSPRCLLDWRYLEPPGPARAAWEQFEPFFEQHGYRLFVLEPLRKNHLIAPPDCSPTRAEDEYSRFLPQWLDRERKHSAFPQMTGIHIAARSPRNTDVIIRIIAIGDEGQEHLAIMRALAAPDAQVPENHTVPMIAELKKDNIVFGVFPFMWPSASFYPWFETLSQLFDVLEQVLEGFDFLHRRLIAHRDFDLHEVFATYGRGYDAHNKQPACHSRPAIFRSCCPDIRYLINDYELSVAFRPESDPATRVVSGIPTARFGGTADNYGKLLPPEALLDAPYCPFRADMYQLGKSALERYANVRTPPELPALFLQMASDDANARPTAAEALATLRAIRKNTAQDVLDDVPPHNILEYRRLAPGELCDCDMCTYRPFSAASYDSYLPASPSAPQNPVVDLYIPVA